MSKYYTKTQAARRIGISDPSFRQMVRRLIAQGKLQELSNPADGRSKLFLRAEIDRIADESVPSKSQEAEPIAS